MNTLGIRTKLLISVAVTLFVLFLFGESSRGRRFLTGQPSNDPYTSNDKAMGAGLMPIIYCAVPSGVLLVLGFVSYRADRRRVG